MSQLCPNVKNTLRAIDGLLKKRMDRRARGFPCFDLSFRIWWNVMLLKKIEGRNHG